LETNAIATEHRQIPSWFGHSSFEFRHSNLSLICRMAFEVACVVADHRPGMLRDDASDFICVSRAQANLSLETNAIATEKSPYSVLVWSLVIRVSSSSFSLIRRMAFEGACVVVDHRPGMLRDDASDFICVSRDQANL
jgi:hypothetical protein